MTWQIEHSIPFDANVDGVQQARDACRYFIDTFLPTKGWTVGFREGEDASSRYRIVQRNFTDLFTGNADKHYLWFDVWGTQYEDATYNVTPGDKGTDSTNSRSFQWYSSSEWSQHSFKFWRSTSNPRAFIVTRWNQVLAFDMGNDWYTYRPDPSIEQGPSIDRWDTCVFLGMNNSNVSAPHWTNLPYSDNTNTGEINVQMGPTEPKDRPGSKGGFFDTIYFWYRDADYTRVSLKQDDVKWFNSPNYSYNYFSSSYLDMRQILIVQVNNGNYWLFTRGDSTSSQMCLDIGATIPDLD